MRRLSAFLVAATAIVCLTVPALAQSSLGIGNAEVAMQPGTGPLAGLFLWIGGVQREFFTGLRQGLVALRAGEGGVAPLVGLSFVYGVFHAAGPGHGKAVISSYMLANEVQLRRGVALSFLSAGFQALSALLLVGVGWYVLRGTGLSMTTLGWGMEVASYAMIAVFGFWLLARKLGRLWATRRAGSAVAGGLAFAEAGSHSTGRTSSRFAATGYDPDVCQAQPVDCDCGRAHMQDPASLATGRFTIGSGVSAALAVGLRPCAGAIVVLTFALVNGLWLGGVLSVLAMALGTAITVSALAALAVYAKGAALRFAGRSAAWRDVMEIAGALLLVLFGLLLLGGALQM
ncbi:nickel/cobalt transporter [Aureimonas altamirensis]|uniref:nickel/cobalt transporter n=1 Tax=Aureimonas altamirensis TaxID=370622 RepID=UPI0020370204|nr:nickel/cobalt transporter [Aureimonas altamirensis]MCM2503359.1 nickel/cobalt transporter [Aureimonas altamirensis]